MEGHPTEPDVEITETVETEVSFTSEYDIPVGDQRAEDVFTHDHYMRITALEQAVKSMPTNEPFSKMTARTLNAHEYAILLRAEAFENYIKNGAPDGED